MTEPKPGDRLAALEQARAQMEIALEADRDWVAFRQADAGPDCLLHERAFAGNPLFRSWLLLERAIADLKAKAAERDETERDDLTRIRGIDRALAGRLAERGVTRYGQIVAWRADEVRDIAMALGLGRRISRQNWIEQAALLDLRRRTGRPELIAPSPSAAPSGMPAVAAPQEQARSKPQRIGLQQILEHIRNAATLRGDPPPAAHDRGDEAPDGQAAAAAHVELPARSEPAMAPWVDANAETNERDQRAERADLAAVDSSLGSEEAGRGFPEPEEATVTFVIRERVYAGDAFSADGQAALLPADQAAAPAAVDASYVAPGLEAEEAEVSIVSRPARRKRNQDARKV